MKDQKVLFVTLKFSDGREMEFFLKNMGNDGRNEPVWAGTAHVGDTEGSTALIFDRKMTQAIAFIFKRGESTIPQAAAELAVSSKKKGYGAHGDELKNWVVHLDRHTLEFANEAS